MVMQSEELQVLMQQSAKDAANTVLEELQINLDYSEDSVVYIDQAISEILIKYPEESQEDKAIFTLSNVFGAYLGEVFKRHYGGEWIYSSDSEAPSIYLKIEERTFAFSGICYEKLVRNANTSVAKYYYEASKHYCTS